MCVCVCVIASGKEYLLLKNVKGLYHIVKICKWFKSICRKLFFTF